MSAGAPDNSRRERAPHRSRATCRARDLRIALVASRFNAAVVERAGRGRGRGALRRGRGPGGTRARARARRLRPAARGEAHRRARRFDAIVALGAVIRGDTPHFDYVAGECAAGLARVASETGVPVAFGVLTTDTEEQAVDRAGGSEGNSGADAARVAVELANLMRRLAR